MTSSIDGSVYIQTTSRIGSRNAFVVRGSREASDASSEARRSHQDH